MKNRIFSTDSAKAIKAQGFGFINAIQYLAPHDLSGVNLCSHASPGCIALCLGWMSGQAGMVSDLENDTNEVRESRIEKAQRFMHDRAGYLRDVVRCIENLIIAAEHAGKKLCVRLNGSTDIAWEGIRFDIIRNNPHGRAMSIILNPKGKSFFDHYPSVDFVDYTKNPKRFDRVLPANYHLTFSRSETNEATTLQLLARGVNVAAVFACAKPKRWNGFRVIDGDQHDLRQLDPRGKRGFVIALTPKGRKAKSDQSGFVIK
jgi:hypothetical protein